MLNKFTYNTLPRGKEMRNQKGFGLLELMISVGILSIVMMGLMQVTVNALLAQQTADVKAALTTLVLTETNVAFNQATCTTAITKTPQTFGQAFEFDLLKTNAVLTNYGLQVTNVTYTNPTLVQTGYDGTKVYYGTLMLSTTSTKTVIGPKQFAPRVIASVYVTVNPSGTITQCGPTLVTLPTTAPTPSLPPSAPKNLAFDADPKECENFKIKMTCPASQKIVILESSYGQNCGVKANYGMPTVQTLCDGQSNCAFTAGNANNCTNEGVFIDPAEGCAKGYHASYYCK